MCTFPPENHSLGDGRHGACCPCPSRAEIAQRVLGLGQPGDICCRQHAVRTGHGFLPRVDPSAEPPSQSPKNINPKRANQICYEQLQFRGCSSSAERRQRVAPQARRDERKRKRSICRLVAISAQIVRHPGNGHVPRCRLIRTTAARVDWIAARAPRHMFLFDSHLSCKIA